MSFLRVINEGLEQWEISLSGQQIERLEEFNKLVYRTNEHMNLTSIEDGEPSAKRHFLDSLNPHVLSKINDGCNVIDVGSGAGFPGIPLAIAKPKAQLTLLDARKKRAIFMQEAIVELGLKNVEIICDRAETVARKQHYREQYDIACARAVATMPVLLEYLVPFVKMGGEVVLYKTATPEDEIFASCNAVKVLGIEELLVRTYTVFGENANYSIVSGRKIHQSPTKYPRKSGTPTKRPL